MLEECGDRDFKGGSSVEPGSEAGPVLCARKHGALLASIIAERQTLDMGVAS
jgi:hypothetical protein